MPLTPLTTDLNNVQALADQPNATSGLTPTQVKVAFDASGNAIKTYINSTLIPGIGTEIAAILSAVPDLNRQAIINANFDVSQRGTSFTASGAYTLDMWYLSHNHTSVSVSQQEPFLPDGSRYCARLTNTTRGAGTIFNLIQAIETANCLPFINNQATLSFKVRKSAGLTSGDVSARIRYTTTVNDSAVNAASGTIAATTIAPNASMTTSFQEFTATATIPATARTICITFSFDGSPTDGQYVEISQVQLCAGSVALPFQPRSIAEETELCRRYCFVLDGTENSSAAFGSTFHFSATQSLATVILPVKMRVKPTLAASAASTFQVFNNGSVVVLSSSPTINQATSNIVLLNCITSGGLVTGQGGVLVASGATSKLIFDSSL